MLSPSVFAAPQGAKTQTPLIGFKVWKQQRVVSARNALDTYKGERLKGAVEAKDPKAEPQPKAVPVVTEKTGEALRQLEFNLEIALGLTIHDYFALYLKDKTQSEVTEVIKHLSAEEVSELLMAYRKQLYGVPEQSKTMSKNVQ